LRKTSNYSLKRGALVRDNKGNLHRAAATVHAVQRSVGTQIMQNPLLTGAMARVGSFKLPMSTKDARYSEAYGGPSYRTTEGVWA
jgi:hypothetical protein